MFTIDRRILLAIAGAVVCGGCGQRPFRQTGRAMEPTIKAGERIVADMTAYRQNGPARWDVVVFRSPDAPETLWVFRVVGLPGETVSFDDGKVLIGGEPLEQPPHLRHLAYNGDVAGADVLAHPYVVPGESYYLLGDNPDKANDSRIWGAAARNSILGRIPGK